MVFIQNKFLAKTRNTARRHIWNILEFFGRLWINLGLVKGILGIFSWLCTVPRKAAAPVAEMSWVGAGVRGRWGGKWQVGVLGDKWQVAGGKIYSPRQRGEVGGGNKEAWVRGRWGKGVASGRWQVPPSPLPGALRPPAAPLWGHDRMALVECGKMARPGMPFFRVPRALCASRRKSDGNTLRGIALCPQRRRFVHPHPHPALRATLPPQGGGSQALGT